MNQQLHDDASQFSDLLIAIVADVEKRLASHYASHGLTPPQFYVLKTLHEHNGRCRIGRIAHEHHLTNATMTGLIKRLEVLKPPLVRRERSTEDGRSVDVLLTPEGEARYLLIQEGLLQQARLLLELLPEQERAEIIQRVQAYFAMLRQLFPVEVREEAPDA